MGTVEIKKRELETRGENEGMGNAIQSCLKTV